MALRIKFLGALVVIVFVAWSAFWWFAASTVETASADAITKAGKRGIAIVCDNKTVRGWPFRMTLICDSLGVETKDIKVSANGLRAVALVYNPSHLIIEADSPIDLSGQTLKDPVHAEWKSAQASFQLSSNIIDKASMAFSDIILESAAFRPLKDPVAELLEVHMKRADNPIDLDVALTSRTIKTALGSTSLPEFDLDVVGIIGKGAHLLLGQNRQFLEQVKAGEVSVALDRARVTIGEARVELSGDFALAQNGHLNATPRIAIANVQALSAELARIPGIDMSQVEPFLALFSGFGEKTEIDGAPANAVTLTIRDGRINAGLFPLGRLKPVAF